MKKAILFPLLLIISATSFCRQTNNETAPTNDSYIQKSKQQKTGAFIFLGAGAGLITTAISIEPFYNYKKVGTTLIMPPPDYTYKIIFFITGLASMVASIPFFINSSKNKRKAASLSIKNEKIQTFQNSSFACKFAPAVHFKISL